MATIKYSIDNNYKKEALVKDTSSGDTTKHHILESRNQDT
jgi:hypothetical protein